MNENREAITPPEVHHRDATIDMGLYNLALALQAIREQFPEAFPEAFVASAPIVETPLAVTPIRPGIALQAEVTQSAPVERTPVAPAASRPYLQAVSNTTQTESTSTILDEKDSPKLQDTRAWLDRIYEEKKAA